MIKRLLCWLLGHQHNPTDVYGWQGYWQCIRCGKWFKP